MVFNISSIKASSNGAWQGDNPLDHAFPLLILQTFLILLVSHSLAFLLKPLRQPKVIADTVAGILLGPSAFGRNQTYTQRIFPPWSTPILESVASIGLLFFLFLIGLELDLTPIRRGGRRAFAIAASGISVPFILGIGVAMLLRKTVDGADKVSLGQFLVFIGAALSITAFPVLARILADLKLLTTQVGEVAMAVAVFNDVAAWILLALALAIAGDGDGGYHKSQLASVWVLLSAVGFIIFMMIAIRPVMKWVARRCSSKHDAVDEAYILLTLAGVMLSGLMTDLIGIHSIFGAFVFGLTIPKGGDFAERLIKRIEDFVLGLLLPLQCVSSGLKTDVAKIRGEAWGLLALVITTACAGKILGTLAVAMMCLIPARESLMLGILMNTKGLVQLIVLNIGREKRVLNDEIFAILVLMALFTTFITTPTVMAIYKPARAISTKSHRRFGDLSSCYKKKAAGDLRVLACVHGPGNVPSIIRLIELTRSPKKSPLKLFIMHLVELTERSSSIVLAKRASKDGFPFFNRSHGGQWHDPLAGAFQAYSQCGRVSVRPSTAISSLSTMHEDICHVAEQKRVTMIILPFHKQWRMEMEEEEMGGGRHEVSVGYGWRGVNQRVLKNSPCSVAVLVDRGYGNGSTGTTPNSTQRVFILFLGGPDDREAMELGCRMAEHTTVKVTVMRFVDKNGMASDGVVLRPSPDRCSEKNHSFSTETMNREKEQGQDETAVEEFRRKWKEAVYIEKATGNLVEEVLGIGRSGEYDLMVVGKGRFPSSTVAELVERQVEHAELGPIGDMLASSGEGVVSSVLVIQQHDVELLDEAAVCKVNSMSNDNNI